MKTAMVYKDTTGYWVVWADDTNKKIGVYHDSELAAYRAANQAGYIVR